MGSLMSKIRDDYDGYLYLCEVIGIESKEMSKMFEHEVEILNSLGFKSRYDYYEHLRKIEQRDNKIDSIIE